MTDADSSTPLRLQVGGLSRQELMAELNAAEVLLNAAAEILLESAAFDRQRVESCHVLQRTVGQLGLTNGASLSSIFAKAQGAGLSPCPVIAGPYLRLAMTDQASAPDSVMSNGSAPSGSITVASAPLDDDDDFPKGFYLRVVDGVSWLRGYYASEQHVWSPADCFAFRTSGALLD
jgi:hypothetical protein